MDHFVTSTGLLHFFCWTETGNLLTEDGYKRLLHWKWAQKRHSFFSNVSNRRNIASRWLICDSVFRDFKLNLSTCVEVSQVLSMRKTSSRSHYDTRFLELVRPRLAVLERRDRTGVVVGGDVSLGQPCWSKISMQPLLPAFLAILMAVWPWWSLAFTSIPYCRGKQGKLSNYIHDKKDQRNCGTTGDKRATNSRPDPKTTAGTKTKTGTIVLKYWTKN